MKKFLLVLILLSGCVSSSDLEKLDAMKAEIRQLNYNLEHYKLDIKKMADALELLSKNLDTVLKESRKE